MFGWLFRNRQTQEQAIARATEFLAANGYRVVSPQADADFAADGIPVVLRSAKLPAQRWSVEFSQVLPPGLWRSHTQITVYVWENTGLVTFDPNEEP